MESDDMSWGERMIYGVMRFGFLAIGVLVVTAISAALFAWHLDSPILDSVLKALGIALLFLAVMAVISFLELLQRRQDENEGPEIHPQDHHRFEP